MTDISLSAVNEIYFCSSAIQITQHRFEHTEFRNFCLSLTNFERSLGEDAAEDYWQNFFHPLKQYRFKLCAAPLPFNHPTACQTETIDLLEKHLKKCKFLYSNFSSAAETIFNSLVSLSQSDDNPLLLFIAEHYSNIALLLKNSYLIPTVKDVLATVPKIRQIELLLPSQLRGNNCFKKLVVVGATRWYPDYVFTAPRAQEIEVFQYNFLNDKFQFQPVFLNSINNLKPKIIVNVHSKIKTINTTFTDVAVVDNLEPDEIMPPINLSQIANRFSRYSLVSSEEEDTEARLFLLEGEAAVFLDANAQQHIIDLQEHDEDQVKKIPVTNIEPGMFIILRTSGGSDYIIPLANLFLGEKAQHFRELQEIWKNRLKHKVRLNGLDDVSWNLGKLGSKLANKKQNIHNWMSSRSIRPERDEDYNAILKFIGLADRLNEFHAAAHSIDNAHRKAGHYLRKLLLEEIRKSNFKQLEQQGKINFQLSEGDGGKMTAFRVLDTNKEPWRVPYSKIANAFSENGEVINE